MNVERPRIGSHAGALVVIHKCLRPVIPVRDAGIQRPGMANCGSRQMRLYPQTVTRAWQVALIKHLHSQLVTVHGLDFGIHAEMTAFLAWLNICITMELELGP